MRLLRPVFCASAILIALSGGVFAMDADALPFLPARQEADAPQGARAICTTHDWACAGRTSEAAPGPEQLALVVHLNKTANAAIRPITDQEQYAEAEHWSLPGARGGDCEDYALFKKMKLVEAGISADRLLFAVVLDRKNDPHAVLVLRTDQGDYVLDNVTDRILRWDRTGYTFISMQNPEDPAGWVAVFEQAPRKKPTLRGLFAGLGGKRGDLLSDIENAPIETGAF